MVFLPSGTQAARALPGGRAQRTTSDRRAALKPILGCIADDFTGATDHANNLVRAGMRTVQTIGVPGADFDLSDVDALVVALKSRTTPPQSATRESLQALDWLREIGCRRFFFKYCSTFDSTDRGNIGPVTDALMDALGEDFAIACPAFPENARTVYRGYLFVGNVLLNESGMEHHPLNPMTDANLVRVLRRQARGEVGLLDYYAIEAGGEAVRARIESLRASGCRYAICDALSDDHLMAIADAVADHVLVTGGSGLALWLPQSYRRLGLFAERQDAAALPAFGGSALVLSGSCSRATRAQVGYMAERRPAFAVDPLALAEGKDLVGEAVAWARSRLTDGPVLVYATAEPEAVKRVQEKLGVERAGTLVEDALAGVARQLVESGVRRLVVAGGETSGAVVGALGVKALRIGKQIDPGVPWTAASVGGEHLALALKSGNFGTKDFFLKAFEML